MSGWIKYWVMNERVSEWIFNNYGNYGSKWDENLDRLNI